MLIPVRVASSSSGTRPSADNRLARSAGVALQPTHHSHRVSPRRTHSPRAQATAASTSPSRSRCTVAWCLPTSKKSSRRSMSLEPGPWQPCAVASSASSATVGCTALVSQRAFQGGITVTDILDAPAAVKPINHWISGAPYAGSSGRTGPVFNPATGQQSGAVDFATVEEVDRAVQAAKAAFPAWRALSIAKRAEILFAIRELVHERREEIAKLLTAEHGKVLSDAMGEVTRGLEVIEFCCGIPHLLKGGLPSRPRPASTCTRSASRSASSPASRRSTSRRWSRCGCGRRRSRAGTRSSSSRRRRIRRRRSTRRSCSRRPASPTASSTSSTATRSRSTRSSSIATSPPSRSSARRRSRSTSTRRRPRAASAARRSAARRTT